MTSATQPNTRRREEIVRLNDGRALGYAEYGQPDGIPVMFFNGTPGTRIKGSICSEAAHRAGVRLICPDRPGYGLSDPKPNRLLLQWPDDITQLADALGLSRFAVCGISGGGPHVAACAYKIPERLTGVGIISGAGPFGLTAGTTPKLRGVMRLLARYPGSVRPVVWLIVRALTRWPDATVKRLTATKVIPDQEALRDHGEAYKLDTLEAFRQGASGFVGDLTILARPWGFRLEDIAVPVFLWHGDLDDTVVPEVARYMAATIPNCTATFFPDAGHLVFARHMDTVFAAVATQ